MLPLNQPNLHSNYLPEIREKRTKHKENKVNNLVEEKLNENKLEGQNSDKILERAKKNLSKYRELQEKTPSPAKSSKEQNDFENLFNTGLDEETKNIYQKKIENAKAFNKFFKEAEHEIADFRKKNEKEPDIIRVSSPPSNSDSDKLSPQTSSSKSQKKVNNSEIETRNISKDDFDILEETSKMEEKLEKRIYNLESQLKTLEESESPHADELKSLKSTIKKLSYALKCQKKMNNALKKIDSPLSMPSKMLATMEAVESKVGKSVKTATTGVEMMKKAKDYFKTFESDYLPQIQKDAEEFKSHGILKGDPHMQSLIKEWHDSNSTDDFKTFVKQKFSNEIMTAYNQIKEIEKNIGEKTSSTLESLNKKYEQTLEQFKGHRKALVGTINTVGGNTMYSKGLAKGFEVLYTIGSFIEKPPEHIDTEIKALIEFNKKKNKALDHINEFIMDPVDKISKTVKLKDKKA
jgi:Mg2+ and Co2+ transporter CorA